MAYRDTVDAIAN